MSGPEDVDADRFDVDGEESTVETPHVDDVDCSCGGVMLPNPGNKWVCVDCGRAAELSWRWLEG